ncbi:hypothetical protein ACN28E_49530 [Archangium lansingense]|uniref:hypothetical protein n=1 Tax=Archangium lansingense TaxID=2995310 RepID=UPI003B7C9BC7
MSTRSTHPLPQRPSDPLEHELRVQLEGAWEVLEQARVRQNALLKPLASRRWRRHLRNQPELLRQVRELEAPLGEALARAQHRLEQGSRSEHQPLALLTRQLRTQRDRLETLVRERLARLGEQGGASFVEGLERLETKLREPPAEALFEGEHVLFSIRDGWLSHALLVALVIVALKRGNVLGDIRLIVDTGKYWLIGFALIPLVPVLIGLLRTLKETGRFWLTPQRLVWKPLVGPAKQISLESIGPDGITTEPHAFTKKTGVLHVTGGGETLKLSDVWQLPLMEALLKLHRKPRLLGRVQGPPTYPLAMFKAWRRPADSPPEHKGEPGMLVLRSGQVAFLPERGFDAMLRILFGEWPNGIPEKLTLPLMLRQLSLLPEADFDPCVEQAVHAGGGELWPAATVTHGRAPHGQEYHFTPRQGPVLATVPNASQREAIARVVQHWPPP